MCVNKALMFALYIVTASLFMTGCESASQQLNLDTSVIDKDAPKIIQYFPVDNEQSLETDQPLGILFSEEMDLDSLRSSIHVYEVLESDLGEQSRQEIDVVLDFQTLLLEDSDELTGLPKSKKATRVTITLAERNLPLGQSLFIEVEDTAKDVSSFETNNPLTGNLEAGNFLAKDSNANYDIQGGDWKEISTQDGFSEDNYLFASMTNPEQDIVAYWAIDNGGLSADAIQMARYQAQDKVWTNLAGESSPAFTSVPVPAGAESAVRNMQGVMDSDGRIALVWEQSDTSSGNSGIFFNYFDGTSWLPVSDRVSASDSFGASGPAIAAFGETGFLMAWVQKTASDDRIDYRVFNTALSTPALGALLSDSALSNPLIQSVHLSATPESVLLSWISSDASASFLSASFYRSDGSWIHSGRISPEFYAPGLLSGDVSEQDASVNEEGSGYIVWAQLNNGRKDVYRARIDSEAVVDVSLAEFDNRGDAMLPKIRMGNAGKAALLWLIDLGSSLNVRVALLEDPEDGWLERTEALGAQSGAQQILDGAFDPYNNFYVIWSTGQGSNFVASRRYDNELEEWEASLFIGEELSRSRDAQLRPLATDGRMLLMQSVLSEGVYSFGSTLYDQIDG